MRSGFMASWVVIEFHTVEEFSSLGLITATYNINKLSRVEKEEVMVRVKPSILTGWDKIV